MIRSTGSPCAASRLEIDLSKLRTHSKDSPTALESKNANTFKKEESTSTVGTPGPPADDDYTEETLRAKMLNNYGPGDAPVLRAHAMDCIISAWKKAPSETLYSIRLISARASLARKPDRYFFAAMKKELSGRGLWMSEAEPTF